MVELFMSHDNGFLIIKQNTISYSFCFYQKNSKSFDDVVQQRRHTYAHVLLLLSSQSGEILMAGQLVGVQGINYLLLGNSFIITKLSWLERRHRFIQYMLQFTVHPDEQLTQLCPNTHMSLKSALQLISPRLWNTIHSQTERVLLVVVMTLGFWLATYKIF